MTTTTIERSRSTDDGIGLIEIVISMLLLAFAAVAFLPLAIQGIKQTATNATLATATQVMAQQLEQVGAAGSSCTAVKDYAAATPAEVPHARGPLQPHLFLDLPASDVCDGTVRTVPLRIWITKAGSSIVLAEVNRLVYLDAP